MARRLSTETAKFSGNGTRQPRPRPFPSRLGPWRLCRRVARRDRCTSRRVGGRGVSWTNVRAGGRGVALSGATSGTVTQTVASSTGVWTFQWPGAPAAARQWLTTNSSGAGSFTQPADADIVFSDVTTGNVSASGHGYVPKAPNDATQF